MVTTRVSIPRRCLDYLRNTVGRTIEKNFNFVPTDSQLVEYGIKQLEANQSGKEFEVIYNKKKKCLIIK